MDTSASAQSRAAVLYIPGPSGSSDLSGDYTLLEANPACFVMGEIIPNKSSDSKCLFWTLEWTKGDNRNKCERAFLNNCSTLQVTSYSMEKYWRFCNFCTYENDTISSTPPS
ncbi:hypothetical protein MTO96_016578 [Rhipicephalus appendiculatus]